MNSLVQRARELSESAQSRIDFREAIPIYADFAEELQKDTQLELDYQPSSSVAGVGVTRIAVATLGVCRRSRRGPEGLEG